MAANGNEKNARKTHKFLIILLLIGAVAVSAMALAVLNSIYRKQFSSYVHSLNAGAASAFKVMELSDEFTVILNGTEEGVDRFIYGDRSVDGSYVAYQGAFIAKDMLIFGEPYSEPSTYWAARVVDKKVMEVWFSEFPLGQKDLHTYSFDEQMAEYRFLQKFRESGAVGYYRADNTV
ncbi:hypothetical protein [Ruminococcus flavefaciens]|uniref:hypothetical protein n=1 Tax=Ruminococcus flavefaciens TaxID=1265 RepID=UPI0013DACC75|nr:hypothetical protein [Ruminococcus flavefaciens]